MFRKTFGIFALFVALIAPLSVVVPAQAASSPWSSDSVYGCIDQPIHEFAVMPSVEPQKEAFKLVEGRLPDGLELNPETGVISGSPKGTYSDKFTIYSPIDADYPTQTFMALIDERCRPTIEAIRPDRGPNTGGTEVTITGSGFDKEATVAVDDAGTPIYLRDFKVEENRIVGVMPEYSGTGPVTIIIRNPDGSRYYAKDAFTYEATGPSEPKVGLFNTKGENQTTSLAAVHYSHVSPSIDGQAGLIMLTNFGTNIRASFPVDPAGVYNSVNNGMLNCPNTSSRPVTLTSAEPIWAPKAPDGSVYRGLNVQTGSYVSGAPYACITPGTYPMKLHVSDEIGHSVDFDFTIVEAPGAPTEFLQPKVEGVPSFGDFTVGVPMADDPNSPNPGRGIRTDGDAGVFSITSNPLIPDLAIQVVGGKGGSSSSMVVGTPTASGPYSFTITSTVAGASPSTYSHQFSGFVRYSTSHAVTFDGNGSTSGTMGTQSSDIKTQLRANAFSKAGNTFNGWSASPTGGGAIYVDSAMYEFANDVTLYAQWVEIPPFSHTVVFNGNGATGGIMANQSNAGPTGLNSNQFTRTGYEFDEWNTVANGSGTVYRNGQTFPFNQDETLYAMWELPPPSGGDVGVTHTITFDGNGASSGFTSPQSSNSPAAVRSNGFVRPGYTFHDWNSTNNHTGFELHAGEIYNFGADVTLYAEWTKNPPASVTITVEKPLLIDFLKGDTRQLMINVANTNGVLIPVEVDLPANVVPVNTRVRITPHVTPSSLLSGFVTIQIEIVDANGNDISKLDEVVSIRFSTKLGNNLVAKSDDGLTWVAIPKLSGIALAAGQVDGYYLDADGNVVILSRHLTEFGYKKAQVSVPTSVSSMSMLQVGTSVSLVTAGGSGTGSFTYKSTTPTLCSVSTIGVVKGLKAGSCSVQTTKSGDETYVQAVAKPIKIAITGSPAPIVVVFKIAVMNERPIVIGVSKILLSMGSVNANKSVGVEVSINSNGVFKFLTLAKLSKLGAATVVKTIAVGSTVRIRYAGKTLSSFKFLGN